MTRLAVTVAAALALAGCSTNPITGRTQFIAVSESTALSGSASAYTQMIGGLAKKGQVEADSPRARRVREITERLIAQAVRFRPDSASWNWQITVINDPKTVNAFCMAGGKMAIYSGMWEQLKANDDEIANVMGHEIGHALANHTQERMSVAMGTSVGAALLGIALGSDADSMQRNMALTSGAAALAVTLPNSRAGESEADQIGIELAARAGFDPRGAVTLWEKMGKLGGSRQPQFLSTHPSPATRQQDLRALVAKVDHFYQQAKASGPAGGVPSFLTGSVNERAPGEQSRQEYAAKVSREADTLTFLSEPFERFKRGDTAFECRFACAGTFAIKRGDWKKMHDRGDWRDLAVSVIQVGYLSDLSYFMLAESAKGLGLNDAAKRYYARAVDADKQGFGCGGAVDACAGFEVQQRAAAAR